MENSSCLYLLLVIMQSIHIQFILLKFGPRNLATCKKVVSVYLEISLIFKLSLIITNSLFHNYKLVIPKLVVSCWCWCYYGCRGWKRKFNCWQGGCWCYNVATNPSVRLQPSVLFIEMLFFFTIIDSLAVAGLYVEI